DEVYVNIDSLPPRVAIEQPAPNTPTRAPSIHVEGTASDPSPFTLKVEGVVVPVVNGRFATDVPLPTEGSRTVTVYAIDAARNDVSVPVTVIVDRPPPDLAVVSPGAPVLGVFPVLGALPVSVVGTVHDQTDTTVVVDTVNATRTGEAWQASVGGLPEGNHTFT